MTDISARIAHYRHEVRHAADLEAAANVFMDTVGTDPSFLAEGRRHDDRRLREIVAAALSRVLRGRLELVDTTLVRLDDQRFVHGSILATLERRGGPIPLFVVVTYFEEDDAGLCIAVEPDMHASYVRFGAHTLSGPTFVGERGTA